MSEQRTGIVGGTADYVADRDAYDASPGARKVQRIDFASNHIGPTFNSAPNRQNTGPAGIDTADITNFVATGITFGDCSSLVISADFTVSGPSSAALTVVPIFYDASYGTGGVPMFIGDDLIFVANGYLGPKRGATFMSPVRIVDSMGANFARLFVKANGTGAFNLYGWPI